jgi:hypothetical protein
MERRMTDSANEPLADSSPLAPGLEPALTHSLPRRLLGRFALLAFALYHVPLFINDYPTFGGGGFRRDGLAHAWGHVFGQVGLWVARHVFGMTEPMPSALEGDNGDTAQEFCRLLVGVVLAAGVAVGWVIADRRRPRARWVEPALLVLLRYSIMLGLTSYAMAKLYPIQFNRVPLITLEQHVGELSPASLLWSFMQYSRVYSTFAGVMEMLVVVLLVFRRTTTLGALLCIVVLTNVALMNLCYGVPVKLFSISMVLSAAVIVLYDAPRIASVLGLGRGPTPPVATRPLRLRRLNQLGWSVKLVLVGGVILSSAFEMSHVHSRRVADDASPLTGTWEVQSLVKDGRELAQSTEPNRWRRLIVMSRRLAIRLEDNTLVHCQRTPDAPSQTLAFTCPSTHQEGSLHWSRTGTALLLEGTFDSVALRASLTERDDSELPLMQARFKWIYD